jgi:SP family xylose:H+ symportor-like MFS transporter
VSVVAALGGLLFGYDTAVISGAIDFLNEHFDLDSTLEGVATSSALLGCVVGVSFAGVVSDRFGRKRTMMVSAALFLFSALGTARPEGLGAPLVWALDLVGAPRGEFWSFVVFRFVGGIGVGVASMTSPIYIAEITPARIRGRMVSVNQFAIVTGMLVVYFVNYFITNPDDMSWNVSAGWRWMFASEALPALVFLLVLVRVPESPRWLVEAGQRSRALALLEKVVGRRRAPGELAAVEAVVARDPGDFRELFRRPLSRILLIGVALAILQQVTGINVFLYFAPEIFKQLGSGVDASLLQTIVVGAVNLSFTVVAIWTVDRTGRRPLMIIGSTGMGLSLLAIGLAAQFQAVSTWVLVFMLSYIACFALSVGPVTWVILSEIFPTALRGRAVSVATFFLWSANALVTFTFSKMRDDEWLIERFHGAFPFYIYASFCLVLLLVVLYRVPETKGKSLEEIESFWSRDPHDEP